MLEQNLVNYIEKSLKQNWDLKAFSNFHSETLTYAQVADRIIYLHKFFPVHVDLTQNYNTK